MNSEYVYIRVITSTSKVCWGFIINILVFLFSRKKNQKNCKFITLSKGFHAFALVDQRHFSTDFAIYLKLRFCIENQWEIFYWKSIDLPASKTSGFPLISYKGIFKDIFLLILLYFWNSHFILKTNTKVPFLFEEMKSPYFIWRIESPFFYLKKLNSLFLIEQLKVPFFIWNLIPFFYLKKLKVLILFDEMKTPYFIWRIKSPFFIWRIESPFFIFRNLIPFFIWRSGKPLFIWRNREPPFYLTKWKAKVKIIVYYF